MKMLRPSRYLSLILLLGVFISKASLEAHNDSDQVTADSDSTKRSTIVEVDGYAYLSEDKTPRQMREEALANAKREALERAQTYIQSVTKVENFILSYDLIQSGAEGYVTVLESKDHGITSDNRYHYWIRAEVEYALKAQQDKKAMSADLVKDENAPLTVYVWAEKKEYRAGEKIRIFIQGNKDFYARVVYRDVQGKLLQLLPNPHREENFFEGGKVLTIPGEGDQFDLEVAPPFGIENIIVYASSAQMGEANLENVGGVVYGVKDDLKDYGVKTRGVKIVTKKEETAAASVEFYETWCEIRTKM